MAGRFRAIGSVAVVDPSRAAPAGTVSLGPSAAVLPLGGTGALVSALAPTATELRRLLDRGAALLGGQGDGRVGAEAGRGPRR